MFLKSLRENTSNGIISVSGTYNDFMKYDSERLWFWTITDLVYGLSNAVWYWAVNKKEKYSIIIVACFQAGAFAALWWGSHTAF